MKSIRRHTADLKRERLSHKQEHISGRDLSAVIKARIGTEAIKARIGTEASNLSTAFSEMDNFVNMAKMPGAGYDPGLARGGWRVTARTPEKPYQPILKDIYPRNQYTMMPTNNGPKYYSGQFMKFDYKDVPQQPNGEHNDGRPVVFKKQDIETVQTKKKFGDNPKGQSAIPLHLCNDTNSLLYQRSLQPTTRDRVRLRSNTSSTRLSYPYAIHKHVNNEESALHPPNYSDPIQTWINTKYHTGRNREHLSTAGSSSTSFEQADILVNIESTNLRSGLVRTAPEWYSEFFPRQKVADTMKFMGSAKQSIPSNKSEYDVNFHGKR